MNSVSFMTGANKSFLVDQTFLFIFYDHQVTGRTSRAIAVADLSIAKI